jgi:oligosaccharide repeat unit polymerase
MRSAVPLVVTLAVFALALIRLPRLHPIQIWSASWAVSLTMYTLRLLPYRSLSWLTVGLICGSTLTFSLGVLAGDLASRRSLLRGVTTRPNAPNATGIRLAAGASLLAGAVLLLIFLAQLAQHYGLAGALRASRTVRLALVHGEAPKAFVYSEFAIVAAALCSLAAALATDRASCRRWLVASACAIASLYFSTARQQLVDAFLIAVIIFALTRGRVVIRVGAVKLGAALMLITLAIVLGVGAIIGNTYKTNEVSTFDNFFTRTSAVSWLSPAYVDVSAPIPALDIAVKVSRTWGRASGCATAPFECRMLRHLGAGAEVQPLAPAFTRSPVPWNAYTFLGTLLNDGGTALVLVLAGLCGVLFGVIWSLHRRATYGTLLYAFSIPVLVWAYRQNLLDVQMDAAVLAIGLAWLGTRVARSAGFERLRQLGWRRARLD